MRPYDAPIFLSTLSLRRATECRVTDCNRYDISIHALLAESDCGNAGIGTHISISIHALLAESDGCGHVTVGHQKQFLSTLSLRRATSQGDLFQCPGTEFLSTLSLRRATTVERMIGKKERVFLSTLSLRRATDVACGDRNKLRNFYPRSPCGERRNIVDTAIRELGISIHALLAESDWVRSRHRWSSKTISIHALLAESDSPYIMYVGTGPAFLSTLSLRRATP